MEQTAPAHYLASLEAIPLQAPTAPAVLGEVERKPCEAEPTYPYPPRRWWLKRVAVSLAVVAVMLLAVRLGWGWEADRRMRRQTDEMAAAGESTGAADLQAVPLADEDNAAVYLKRAAAALVPGVDSPASSA